MKLKNKETGEIVDITMPITDGDGWSIKADSLAELCEDWEDVPEEPNIYWYITSLGEVVHRGFSLKKWGKYDDDRKQMGNYFLTKEEAELAVKKLEAWKRLKDKGFKLNSTPYCDNLCGNGFEIHFSAIMPPELWNDNGTKKDLTLLFGDEE